MTYVIGTCIKPIKKEMKPFVNCPVAIPVGLYGYDIGATIYADLKEGHQWHDEKETHLYTISVRHEHVTMTREELEQHIDIHFEYQDYNACIQEDVPCKNLRGHRPNEQSRDRKQILANCRIDWEVGRGTCARYEQAEEVLHT